ncbi:YaiI/YqxD family protein [Pseudoteredinibacter isoporae]|uniref:YaiI/YqxD family protein n=1 Tax=Pseudoteredinibacter isoporae TaxID=570281 RepID=UPI003102B813
MTIWVDADACPVAIKEILFRAANRAEMPCCLIANQYIPVPKSKFISSVQVSHGFDVADNEIVQRCAEGDLVITSDIPLAAEVIEKGAKALSPRGEPFSKANIGARLNMRDFMDTMRASGIQSGGPPPLGVKEKQAFANQLDKYLAKCKRDQSKT